MYLISTVEFFTTALLPLAVTSQIVPVPVTVSWMPFTVNVTFWAFMPFTSSVTGPRVNS